MDAEFKIGLNATGVQAGAQVAVRSMQQIRAAAGQTQSQMGALTQRINQSTNGFHGFTKGIGASSSVLLNFNSVLATVSFVSIVRGLVETAVNLDKIRVQFKYATGSMEGFKREMGFATSLAKQYNLSIEDTALGAAKFAAAAKGTALTGNDLQTVIRGLSMASATFGLSAADTQGAFKALEQMVSKGRVQMEELRGQLSDRIPGAFNTLARALGVTTQQLEKMTEKGLDGAKSVKALAQQWVKDFSGSAAESADTMTGKINRFQNALFELSQTLLNAGVSDFMSKVINETSAWIKDLGIGIDRLKEIFGMNKKSPALDAKQQMLGRIDNATSYSGVIRYGTSTAGAVVGGGIGAWGGAKIGGALGTAIAGPIGTLVGGGIGGIIGGIGGSFVGSSGADEYLAPKVLGLAGVGAGAGSAYMNYKSESVIDNAIQQAPQNYKYKGGNHLKESVNNFLSVAVAHETAKKMSYVSKGLGGLAIVSTGYGLYKSLEQREANIKKITEEITNMDMEAVLNASKEELADRMEYLERLGATGESVDNFKGMVLSVYEKDVKKELDKVENDIQKLYGGYSDKITLATQGGVDLFELQRLTTLKNQLLKAQLYQKGRVAVRTAEATQSMYNPVITGLYPDSDPFSEMFLMPKSNLLYGTFGSKQNLEYTEYPNRMIDPSNQTQIDFLKKDFLKLGAYNPAKEDLDFSGWFGSEDFDSVYSELEKNKQQVQKLWQSMLEENNSALQDFDNRFRDSLTDMQVVARGWADDFGNSLAEAFQTGSFSFSKMINSILNDLMRLQLKKSVVNPLMGMFPSIFGEVNPDLIGGSVFDGFKSGSTVDTGSGLTVGGNWNLRDIFDASQLISGPDFDIDTSYDRLSLINGFSSLPAYADGGYVGRPVPVLAHEGELILNPAQQGMMFGSSKTTVVVNDYRNSGQDIQVEETRGQDGERIIELTILDTVRKGMLNGTLDKDFSSVYGLQRRGR